MNIEQISFEVNGATVVGLLHRPESAPRAALLLTGPLTSVKEQATGAYARAMAARGFVALAFDHRTFGESGGEPRQFESPPRKIEDIRAAAAFLGRHGPTANLPLGAIGICAGGGYMAGAVADEPRLLSFAAVAGVFPDAQATRAWVGEKFDAVIDAARAARLRFEAGGPAERIPAVGDGEVAMPLAEAFEFYGTPRGAVPNYTNSFAVQSREFTLPFDAMVAADRIRVPTLMVHSERALLPALARQFFERLKAPKQELWLRSRGQIDFYDDPVLIDASADAIAAHFESYFDRMRS
jgi:fermentation-respiration switch protein FrsA (DUF1100 family)